MLRLRHHVRARLDDQQARSGHNHLRDLYDNREVLWLYDSLVDVPMIPGKTHLVFALEWRMLFRSPGDGSLLQGLATATST